MRGLPIGTESIYPRVRTESHRGCPLVEVGLSTCRVGSRGPLGSLQEVAAQSRYTWGIILIIEKKDSYPSRGNYDDIGVLDAALEVACALRVRRSANLSTRLPSKKTAPRLRTKAAAPAPTPAPTPAVMGVLSPLTASASCSCTWLRSSSCWIDGRSLGIGGSEKRKASRSGNSGISSVSAALSSHSQPASAAGRAEDCVGVRPSRPSACSSREPSRMEREPRHAPSPFCVGPGSATHQHCSRSCHSSCPRVGLR